MFNGNYTQNNLPSELFNVSNGDVKQYNGQYYKITVENNGTRTLVPVIGPSGQSTTGNSANDIMLASINKVADEYAARYKDFDLKNPFSMDKILAKETEKAKQRLDPYYKQTLSDYLTGVNAKMSRNLEDQRTLLDSLNKDTESYIGKDKIALQDTLSRTRQGFADSGTYFSGAQQRAVGKTIAADQTNLSDYMRGQNERQQNINTLTGRNVEDLALEKSQNERQLGTFDASGNYVGDTAVARNFAVKSAADTAAAQDYNLWSTQKQQMFQAPPGVSPDVFAQTNTNILKDTLGA